MTFMCLLAGIANVFAGFRWWIMLCSRATQRHISAYNSSTRRDTKRKVSRVRNDSSVIYNKLELDSHADTIVLGNNCVILSHTGRECDVSPFTETYQSISNVPIVSGATAWTCPENGDTFILVFHEALWMGDVMDHTLVNPNQLRYFGITVQDNPYAGIQMHLATESGEMYFPLCSEGTTIYLDTRTPTDRELHECKHIQMSSKSPWDPHAVQFPEIARREEAEILPHGRISAFTTTQNNDCDCE